mgnify:CR=1 FL=1
MLDSLCAQLLATSAWEWLGIVTGISGVLLSIKEKRAAWPLFILCYAAYVYISYQYGLKAFMLMNAVFIGISLYGWYKWSQPGADVGQQVAVSHTPRTQLWIAISLILCGTLALGTTLEGLGEAQHPYPDAFATCCGLVAQWMLSRKHVETWIFWIITDLVYIRLLGEQGSLTSVLLFAVFIVLAIKGWRDWRTTMRAHPQASA